MKNDYPITSFEVEYKLDDIDARTEASPTATLNQSFADIELIKDAGGNSKKFLSTEHNYSVLDGSYGEYNPATDTIAYYSTIKSDSNGDFSQTPTIECTFTHYHQAYTLTLRFVQSAPTQVRVTWYHGSEVLATNVFDIDTTKTTATLIQKVESYNKIKIEFLKALPDRYIKLNNIEFGTTIYWDENSIKSGTLVQGLNRVGDSLSIDTLYFEVIDQDNILNLGNPNGIYQMFQRNQAMYAREYVNGTVISLGRFYLDTFTHENHLGKINAYSLMGILDKCIFRSGGVYFDTPVKDIVAEILTRAQLPVIPTVTYTDSVGDIELSGSLGVQTCREALRQVLFAADLVINTTNKDSIIISRYSQAITGDITRSNKISTRVSNNEYVSGVKINYTTYTAPAPGQAVEEILTAHYEAGTQYVEFSTPYSPIFYTISTGTLDEVSEYYIRFTLESASEVTISGVAYAVHDYTAERHHDPIKTGECENVKEFSSTMCTTECANNLTRTLLNYYDLMALKIDVQHYTADAKMNDMRTVHNNVQGMNNFIGMFEERTIDLTGGFLDSATLMGYYDVSDNFYYAVQGVTVGTSGVYMEIYAGEAVGVL